jgi:hypothetical protein
MSRFINNYCTAMDAKKHSAVVFAMLVALFVFLRQSHHPSVSEEIIAETIESEHSPFADQFSSLQEMRLQCSKKALGDGRCDPACNTKEHNFDHGDCCLATCRCGSFACGSSGFQCRDSTVSSSTAAFIQAANASAVQEAHYASLFPVSSLTLHVRRGGDPFEMIVDGSSIPDRGSASALDVLLQPMSAGSGAASISTTVTQSSAHRSACYQCQSDHTAKALPACTPPRLRVKVTIPVGAAVGAYQVSLHGAAKVVSNLVVFVMFNPWHPKDAVYMPSNYLRHEHLVMQSAGVCTGRQCKNPIIWGIDQFTPTTVAAAAVLLGKIPFAHRGDALQVSRHLASKINSEVLEGKWSSAFKDGTDPTKWLSSVEILHQFLKNQTKVKYGQCWVFAGLVASLLRCVGIPARIVSAERAAIPHTRPIQARMHRYWTLDRKGKIYHLDQRRSDGMWYYHVWNDAWMSRPGMAHSSVGWQALDATPSKWAAMDSTDSHKKGRSVLGPASLSHIKQLGTKLNNHGFDDRHQCFKIGKQKVCKRDRKAWMQALELYDEAFITSEVAADKLEFVRDNSTQKYTLNSYLRGSYGTHMFTQKPSMARGAMIDVICEYKTSCKQKKANVSEHMDMVSAPLVSDALVATHVGEDEDVALASVSDVTGYHDVSDSREKPAADVVFHMLPVPNEVRLGRTVQVRVKAKLATPLPPGQVRTVNMMFTRFTHDGRNMQGKIFGRSSRTVTLSSNSPHITLSSHVPPSIYHKYLAHRQHKAVSFAVMAMVKETQQRFTTLDNRPSVGLSLPPIMLHIRRGADSVHIKGTWYNPQQSRNLCGCTLKVHIIGSEQTKTWRLGCVAGRKHVKVRTSLRTSKLRGLRGQKIGANSVVACRGGFFSSGFTSE